MNYLGWKLQIDNKHSSKLKKLAFLKHKLHSYITDSKTYCVQNSHKIGTKALRLYLKPLPTSNKKNWKGVKSSFEVHSLYSIFLEHYSVLFVQAESYKNSKDSV